MPTLLRLAPAVPALLALAACGDDPVAPPPTPVALCTDAPFVAYRNDGAPWVRVLPASGTRHEFTATPRVTLAQAWGDRPLPYLVVEYLSAEQAARAHPCDVEPPPTLPPPDVVTGVVRPWDGVGGVRIAYGTTGRLLVGADSTFGLPAIEGTSDLLASRWTPSATAPRADAVILRRGVSYPAGARVTLDFGSPEAFAPESRVLHAVLPYSYATVTLRTAAGQSMLLSEAVAGQYGDPESARELSLSMIPAARLDTGDIQHVELRAEWRSVEHWMRAPRDLQTALGPPLARPVVRTLARVPHRRLAVTLPAQAEYAGSVLLSLHQAERSASVMATRAHFGAASRGWTLELPDLAGVEGFPARAGLQDAPTGWGIMAWSNPELWYFARRTPPPDGAVHWSATASGDAP